jgi:hypothetical protein
MKHSLWLVVALLAVPVLERAALAQGTADKPAAARVLTAQAGGPKVLPGAPPTVKPGARRCCLAEQFSRRRSPPRPRRE